MAECFPDSTEHWVRFTCKDFFVEGLVMILLPDPEILIGDCAKPNPSWTNALNVPVVNVAIIKYASFVRGEASCERRGFSSSG